MASFSYPTSWDVRYSGGSLILGSGLTVSNDGKILVASGAGGTVTAITAGTGLNGGTINSSGTISLRPPTAGNIGGVKAGGNINIAADGTISAVLPGGTGTVTGVFAGAGLSGGGVSGGVTLSLSAATSSAFGGVVVGPTLVSGAGGLIDAPAASDSTVGQVRLATNAETITGALNTVAVTPQGLANKVASTSAYGITILSNSTSSPSTAQAATSAAVQVAYDQAVTAQSTASAALPLAGGTMTGTINFAPGQSFIGVGLPVATTTTPGVVIPSTGLAISPSGYLTTTKNGTVTSITTGIGLGAPATGNAIISAGTINLLAATSTVIGGVKPGLNLSVAIDGTLNVGDLIRTNRPYAYNSYVWPLESTPGQAPGPDGSFLKLVSNVTGEVAWVPNTGVTAITAGTGLNTGFTGITPNANPITYSGTINLTDTTVLPGSYGYTGVLPTLTVDQQGRLTSAGSAFPFAPFQFAGAPSAILQLDLGVNATNWEFTLSQSITIANPLNAVSGMRGVLLLRQDPITPRVITWDAAWKFADAIPAQITAIASAVDMFEFTVVAANYIVVTGITTNIG